MDSLIKLFARRHQTNLHNAPAFEWLAPRPVHFGDGFAREQAYFDGPNQFLFVRRSNFCGSLRVEPLQNPAQLTERMFVGGVPQPFTLFLGTLGYVRKALKQSTQIQSGTNGENRQPSALAQVFQHS